MKIEIEREREREREIYIERKREREREQGRPAVANNPPGSDSRICHCIHARHAAASHLMR